MFFFYFLFFYEGYTNPQTFRKILNRNKHKNSKPNKHSGNQKHRKDKMP